MSATPFRLLVQRADGVPVAGARLSVAPVSEPFEVVPAGGTVKLAAVALVADGDGVVSADLLPGRYAVRIDGGGFAEVDHIGDATAPVAAEPKLVSGLRRAADGAPAVLPVTFRPAGVQVVGRALVTRDPVMVEPVAGLVTVALVPGFYAVSQPGERAGLVQVPGDWLVVLAVGPALWDGSETTWGGAPANWGLAA